MEPYISEKCLHTEALEHDVVHLVIGLLFSATLCVIVGAYFWLTAIMITPLGLAFIFIVPVILASFSTFVTQAIFGIPIIGGLSGWWFARNTSSSVGSLAVEFDVNLYIEGHPVYEKVQDMAADLGIPPIKWVGYYEENSINAFACGTKQEEAMLVFTTGALDKLTKEQFDAVIGHELAHVASNDMQRMTFAHGIQQGLSWFLIFRGLKRLARWMFTPLSEIVILKMSRDREFVADAVGAYLTSPDAMAGALKNIQNDQNEPEKAHKDYAKFMLKANDFGLFRTHPPTDDRIKALQEATHIDQLPIVEIKEPQYLF